MYFSYFFLQHLAPAKSFQTRDENMYIKAKLISGQLRPFTVKH